MSSRILLDASNTESASRWTGLWPDRFGYADRKVDQHRDVIAFPKVKDASCLMTQAPQRVSEAQLNELGLEVEKEETEE